MPPNAWVYPVHHAVDCAFCGSGGWIVDGCAVLTGPGTYLQRAVAVQLDVALPHFTPLLLRTGSITAFDNLAVWMVDSACRLQQR